MVSWCEWGRDGEGEVGGVEVGGGDCQGRSWLAVAIVMVAVWEVAGGRAIGEKKVGGMLWLHAARGSWSLCGGCWCWSQKLQGVQVAGEIVGKEMHTTRPVGGGEGVFGEVLPPAEESGGCIMGAPEPEEVLVINDD